MISALKKSPNSQPVIVSTESDKMAVKRAGINEIMKIKKINENSQDKRQNNRGVKITVEYKAMLE